MRPKRLDSSQWLLLCSCLLLMGNLFYLTVSLMRNYIHTPAHVEPGIQFATFKPFLKNIKTIGYVTDKEISREHNDGTFLQAQYYLAPTIIELQSLYHPYLIIDSLNKHYIVMMMKMFHTKRLTHNEYGQALLKRNFP